MNHRAEVDQKALRIAKSLRNDETELIDVLQEVERLKIYEDFTLTSLHEYCTKRLKLSDDRAYTYMRVAKVATAVPALKEAIANNEVSITGAKKIASVITPENQNLWIEKAKTSSTRELEREIVKEKPEEKVKERVKPISELLFELRCLLSPEGEKLLTRVLDLVSTKHKKAAKRGEAVEAALKDYVERHDPVKKAERAMAKQKPSTPVARPTVDKKGRRTQPPREVSHRVMQKTQGQCTFVDDEGHRCANRRWTQQHHIEEVWRGGKHEAANLTHLCSAHHRMVHRHTAA